MCSRGVCFVTRSMRRNYVLVIELCTTDYHGSVRCTRERDSMWDSGFLNVQVEEGRQMLCWAEFKKSRYKLYSLSIVFRVQLWSRGLVQKLSNCALILQRRGRKRHFVRFFLNNDPIQLIGTIFIASCW